MTHILSYFLLLVIIAVQGLYIARNDIKPTRQWIKSAYINGIIDGRKAQIAEDKIAIDRSMEKAWKAENKDIL